MVQQNCIQIAKSLRFGEIIFMQLSNVFSASHRLSPNSANGIQNCFRRLHAIR